MNSSDKWKLKLALVVAMYVSYRCGAVIMQGRFNESANYTYSVSITMFICRLSFPTQKYLVTCCCDVDATALLLNTDYFEDQRVADSLATRA